MTLLALSFDTVSPEGINPIFVRINSTLQDAGLPPIVFSKDDQFHDWFIEDTEGEGWQLTEEKIGEIMRDMERLHAARVGEEIITLEEQITWTERELASTPHMKPNAWDHLRRAAHKNSAPKTGKIADEESYAWAQREYELEKSRRGTCDLLRQRIQELQDGRTALLLRQKRDFPLKNLRERLQAVRFVQHKETERSPFRTTRPKKRFLSWKTGAIAASVAILIAAGGTFGRKQPPEVLPKKPDTPLAPSTIPLLGMPMDPALQGPMDQLMKKKFVECLAKSSLRENTWGDVLSASIRGSTLNAARPVKIEKVQHITFSVLGDTLVFQYEIECDLSPGKQRFFGKTGSFSLSEILGDSAHIPTTIAEENLRQVRENIEKGLQKQFPVGNILEIHTAGISVSIIEHSGIVTIRISLPFVKGGGVLFDRTCTLEPSKNLNTPIVGGQ